jgi:peptide/nickel transport system permease protein
VDPARSKLGAEATDEQVYELNEKYGLNDPVPVRYVKYIVKIVTKGDFGDSYYYDRPVVEDFKARWPNTIKLALLSLMISLLIGIPLGVLSAVKQYSWIDRVSSISAMVLTAIPSFCLAMIFMLVFSYKLNLVPASGATEGWQGWILPSVSLGISYSAQFLRYGRNIMLDTIRQDYVRTARAKGVKERVVLWKHAFRNALLPLITITGTHLGMLLGGVVIMERIFVIPGLGSLVVDGLNRNDLPIVIGSITILSLTFMMIMLAVDILYAVADPRLRGRYAAVKKKKMAKLSSDAVPA